MLSGTQQAMRVTQDGKHPVRAGSPWWEPSWEPPWKGRRQGLPREREEFYEGAAPGGGLRWEPALACKPVLESLSCKLVVCTPSSGPGFFSINTHPHIMWGWGGTILQ